jgi:NAD+-dependent protein deacetylase SIR2
MLFTQNIDCLERVAGVPSDKIIDAHGSFATQRCIECKEEYPDEKMKEHVFGGKVPYCDKEGCKGLVKPDIVFFGEALPKAFDNNTYQVAMADLVLIVGTSLSVYPFAALPGMAQEGKPRVLFNMEKVGQIGTRSDDVVELGDCDAGIRKLADALGWRDELEKLWRQTVGDAEADRQLGGREKNDVQDEVERLAAEVGAVVIDESDEGGVPSEKEPTKHKDGPAVSEKPKDEDKQREPEIVTATATTDVEEDTKEAPKTQQPKLDQAHVEQLQAEASKTESLVTEPPKPQTPKEDPPQVEKSKEEATKEGTAPATLSTEKK